MEVQQQQQRPNHGGGEKKNDDGAKRRLGEEMGGLDVDVAADVWYARDLDNAIIESAREQKNMAWVKVDNKTKRSDKEDEEEEACG